MVLNIGDSFYDCFKGNVVEVKNYATILSISQCGKYIKFNVSWRSSVDQYEMELRDFIERYAVKRISFESELSKL